MPQDYINVSSARLSTWSFPTDICVFTVQRSNVEIVFKFTLLYNPADHGAAGTLNTAIYAGLFVNLENEYIVKIEEGTYTPAQMATELTNKFNQVVTDYLIQFMLDNPPYLSAQIRGSNHIQQENRLRVFDLQNHCLRS